MTRKTRIDARLRTWGWHLVRFDPACPPARYDKHAVEEYATANGPADYALFVAGQLLGIVIRSLVGLDREAAKQALGGFLTAKTLTANQIEFLNLVVDYLTERGLLDAAVLYESPFTDITPQGPDGIFTTQQVTELVTILQDVRAAAMAA